MYQKVPKLHYQVGKDADGSDRFITAICAVLSTQFAKLMKKGLELEESASALDLYESEEFIQSVGLQHNSDSSELSDLEDDEDSISKPLTHEEVAQMNKDKHIALADRSKDTYFLEKDLLNNAPSSTSASDSDDVEPKKPYFQPSTTRGKSKTRAKRSIKNRQQTRQGRIPRPRVHAASVNAAIEKAIPTALNREGLAIQNGGYVADNWATPPPVPLSQVVKDHGDAVREESLRAGVEERVEAGLAVEDGRLHDLQYYIDRKYKVIEWDGIETIPLLDDHDHVFMVLAGRPKSPKYLSACDGLYDLITDTLTTASANPKFPDKFCQHKRGDYVTLDTGVAYSQGMTTLSNRSLTTVVQGTADKILSSKLTDRVLGHLESTHAKFGPKLYAFTRRYCLNKRSFYVCASANSGPNALTTRHTDEMNLGFAWCGIVNVGDFDPILGRHLVLEELRYVVQFPPGSSILLPLACIHHCNTTIQDTEKRAALTFYNPGGMFRYVDNHWMTEKQLWRKDKPHFIVNQMKKATRYQSLLSFQM
ncbi:hypothetical protein NP233_g5557 [Leucocoprinus birnbaumii]|uniref:Uncharacterized protein n=1 Tax=Leucocoprinus birnbaumii TaxID=56174 RepID=A0AAD5VYR2_9AGAR|nr:hypothetical protein NP233_g5557 [Leucocoprinus birnbaumii]